MMKAQIGFAPPRSMRRVLVAVATAAAFTAGGGLSAAAQPDPQTQPTTPPAGAPAKSKPQAKKPAAPAAPAATPSPAQPPPIEQAQAAAPAQPHVQLMFSAWTKICGKDQQQANAKEVCLVIKEARLETGQFVAGAALVEPEGDARKILRVTVPLGMQLQQGTRVMIDQNSPTQRPYVICVPSGCISDYDADPDLVGKLKKGQGLIIQAINAGGQPLSLSLPLGDFAKAYEGPPTDPKVLEEQQKKLQDELQRRAEEARKKLEGPGGQPAANASPPQPGK
jgi:invasion protein IalB